ncbi:FAD-dependent oxidoreductase [Streptomyces sp. MAI_2237]
MILYRARPGGSTVQTESRASHFLGYRLLFSLQGEIFRAPRRPSCSHSRTSRGVRGRFAGRPGAGARTRHRRGAHRRRGDRHLRCRRRHRYPAPFWRDAGLAGAAISRTGPLRELHDISGPGGRPAALFGFAAAQTTGRDLEEAVTAQLAQLFGPAAAEPETLHLQDWSGERWTAPPGVHRLTDYSLFGHPLYRRPAMEGRLHWASTETATRYAGHIEGALAAADRAVTASLTTKEANPCSG